MNRILIVAAGCLALSACQTMGTDSETIRKQFFAGMTRTSYGPLRPVELTAAQAMAVCNPERSMGAPLDQLSVDLAKGIGAAIGLDKTGSVLDEQVVVHDLNRHFKKPQSTTLPGVRLLRNDRNGIDFWYQPIIVDLEETAAAAADWCGRENRRAVYEGVAVGCRDAGTMAMPIGGSPMRVVENYAIAGYRCEPGKARSKPAKKS